MDILVIFEASNLIKSKNYEEAIRNSIRGIIKTSELRGGLKINPIIISSEENREMIINKENNVGKEALLNHIILKGYTEYWREISKCYQKQS